MGNKQINSKKEEEKRKKIGKKQKQKDKRFFRKKKRKKNLEKNDLSIQLVEKTRKARFFLFQMMK